jgi:hypothetical protein
MSAARASRKASRPFATRSGHGRVKRIARSSTSARYHLVFRRRLHLISREIERDAVILVGAGRKVESELRSWQPCICPARRSPQNERDETQLKPKKPRDEIIRIGSCAILLVHQETNPTGHGIRSRWWAPPAQRLHPFKAKVTTPRAAPAELAKRKAPAASTPGVGAGAGPRSAAIRCASRTRHRLRNHKTSGTSGPMRPNILIGSYR